MKRAAARAAGTAGAAVVTALAGLSIWPAASVRAQAPAPIHGASGPDAPDVPPGPAAIRGRILHTSRPGAVAGLPVVLYALPSSGVPGLRGVETDLRGEFAFEDISGDPDTAYLVGVRFEEIPFGQRVTFAPGELERSVELSVSDPTLDAAGLEVGEVRLRVEPSCRDLRIGQAVELRNTGEQVIYVAEASRATRPPLLEMVLPEAASGFEVPTGSFSQGLERVGSRVRFWGPLYPGTQRLEFAYGLPATGTGTGSGTRASHGFPAGAENVLVLSHPGGSAPRGDTLRTAEPTEIEGRAYRVQSAGSLPPGGTLELTFDPPGPSGSSDAVALAQIRMWLELDGAALAVDERYELEVTGTSPLEAAGAPLLCIPLPDAAEELRFTPSTLSMGLTRDPSGALAVRGPLPPGESAVSLRYLLPALPTDGGRVVLERSFDRAVPLLTIFAADTGLVADSDRLHRRRPFRTDDRTYLHLEAFEIEAGEAITLSLTPIAARGSSSRLASGLIVAVLALAALVFLGVPLRARAPREVPSDVVSAAAHEREAVYGAIRDLDDDFETGKLTEDDYRSSRRELRARAVALLREERAAESPSPEPEPPPACPECSAATTAAARFCAQCGVPLSGGAA